MSWTEREERPAPQRRGFGTIIMEAMAERNVGGKVDLDFALGAGLAFNCPHRECAQPLQDYGAY